MTRKNLPLVVRRFHLPLPFRLPPVAIFLSSGRQGNAREVRETSGEIGGRRGRIELPTPALVRAAGHPLLSLGPGAVATARCHRDRLQGLVEESRLLTKRPAELRALTRHLVSDPL